MVSDHPPRLVTAFIFALVMQLTLASAIPRVQPELESNGSEVEKIPEPQSKKQKTTDNEEMDVLIEFYPDENREEEERAKNDHLDRYSYKIINTPRSNDKFPIQPISNDSPDGEEEIARASPDDDEYIAPGYPAAAVKDSGKSRSEQAADSVLQWKVNRPTELEDIVPGFPTWPKHIPEHLRPISPFPDNERGLENERNFHLTGRQTKRDEEAFVPSEKLPPPPRAGPYLYPQSIIGREFEVPFY